MPDLQWYRHVELMVDLVQQVVDGFVRRLLIQAPPRYFKSLVVSRLAPAYYLSIRPHEWVGEVSSTEPLARIMSKDARLFYAMGGGTFKDDSQDASLWRTHRGGGMWARGLGGWALGVGYHLGIIDDPFSKYEEALRPSVQQAAEDYFHNTFYNRRELSGERPAAIIVMHQRLAEGDLAGRLLREEADGESPEEWTVLDLPAVKRPRREPFPKTCKVVPDWRNDGEPLCAELQSIEDLGRLERKNKYQFAAIYLQDPFPDKGAGVFERWWWPEACDPQAVEDLLDQGLGIVALVDALVAGGQLPELLRLVRSWDFAASENPENDACAGVLGGVTLDQRIIWLDAIERHLKAAYVKNLIVQTALQDGPRVEVILPQEPAAAGKILVTDLELTLRSKGLTVHIVPTSGSKRTRALPHAGAAAPLPNGQMGTVLILPVAEWETRFREVHHRFDGVSDEDDLVDAAAYGFGVLSIDGFLKSGWR